MRLWRRESPTQDLHLSQQAGDQAEPVWIWRSENQDNQRYDSSLKAGRPTA